MAKDKKSKERVQRFMSLYDPDNIDYSSFETEDNTGRASRATALNNADNSSVVAPIEGVRDRTFTDLAGTSNNSPSETLTDRHPSIRPSNQSTRELLQDPNSNLVTPNIRPTLQGRSRQVAPLLFGVTTPSNMASSLLSDFDTSNNSPDVMSFGPIPDGPRAKAAPSPEDKLLGAIANTNPTPQSTWKRVLSGLGRGLQQGSEDVAQGNYGGALGKIFSNTVLNAIPAIDSATQYQQNVAQAKQQYGIEKTARDADLSRRKAEADIAETNERLRLTSLQRTQQVQRDAILDAARLRDDKRADADQQLKILEKLPADDPQRAEISRELATKYQLRVSPRYGVDQDFQTIYDEQSGNYVRASADGTPITDDKGNMIIVRPGKQETIDQTKKRAMQEVIAKYGGDAKSVARLSVENRREAIIDTLHKDYQKALRNPSSTNRMVVDEANKAYQAAFNTMLKRDEAFTEALFEREAEDIMRSNKATKVTKSPQATSNKAQATSNSSVAPGYFLKWK